jgi:hypothetical protein
MQKIDDCKEIRLALTRAGIATRPEKCLQTFRLVVTAQYIYHKSANNRQQVVIEKRPFGGERKPRVSIEQGNCDSQISSSNAGRYVRAEHTRHRRGRSQSRRSNGRIASSQENTSSHKVLRCKTCINFVVAVLGVMRC